MIKDNCDKNFNWNLKRLRKSLGFTQEEFSEMIGVRRSLVGAWEEMRSSPMSEMKIQICSMFNIDMAMMHIIEIKFNGSPVNA